MKRIKPKIAITSLCSVALILCALLVVVNVAIPKDLESKAKQAIQTEYDEYYPSEETENANFLSASVGYLEIDRAEDDFVYLTETEKAILAFCAENKPSNGEFLRLKDKRRDIVLATYSAEEWSAEEYEYVLYVDISAILSYVERLNRMVCVTVIVIGAVICVIGLKLGKSIETAQEIRQSFFQNASHELKTPLMAIQGYAEGIQTGVLPSKESAAVILEESDRMTVLIEELLALSKIDSSQTKPRFEETDVVALVRNVVDSFAPSFERSDKKTVAELHGEAKVVCDERQIRKAIANLVSNAFRHCKTTVTVGCRDVGNNTVIAVSDDGEGIAKEDLAHIFERFYTGKNGNTGIGLALAKEIVGLHGGEITARNDGGAVFEISLPKLKGKINK